MTDSISRSHFKHLGLRWNASEVAIRAAYRVLALRYHPDKADEGDRSQATARLQELQVVYEHCLNHIQSCPKAEEVPNEAEGETRRESSGNEY